MSNFSLVGSGVTELQTPQNCYFPLTCCVALATVYALPCDTVMGQNCRCSLSNIKGPAVEHWLSSASLLILLIFCLRQMPVPFCTLLFFIEQVNLK